MEFLTKEHVRTYSYTTINKDRSGVMEEVVNGRKYFKSGEYQSVTLVANLYRVYDPSVKFFKNVLHVGVARQHPSDIVIDRQLSYETANINALMNPVIIMEVGKNFNKSIWTCIARAYIESLDLKFIKTAKERMIETQECEKAIIENKNIYLDK